MPQRDYQKLKYDADMLEAMGYVKEWSEKSDNEQLHKMRGLMLDIYFYVHGLHKEREMFDEIVDEVNLKLVAKVKENKELKYELQQIKKNLRL